MEKKPSWGWDSDSLWSSRPPFCQGKLTGVEQGTANTCQGTASKRTDRWESLHLYWAEDMVAGWVSDLREPKFSRAIVEIREQKRATWGCHGAWISWGACTQENLKTLNSIPTSPTQSTSTRGNQQLEHKPNRYGANPRSQARKQKWE